MTRSWQDNAAEFAALDQGEGWPFAILVACSVVKAPGRIAIEILAPKVNASTFAKKADTSTDRVLRYLTTWEKAVADGIVPDASSLTPEDAHKVRIPDERFGGKYVEGEGGYYDGSAQTGGIPTNRVQATKATTLVEKMTPEQRVEVAKAIVDVAPKDDVDAVHNKVWERKLADGELERMADGREPVTIESPTTYNVFDAVGDITDARLRIEKAGAEFVAAIKAFGSFSETDPTAAFVRTTVMEALDLISMNVEAER